MRTRFLHAMAGAALLLALALPVAVAGDVEMNSQIKSLQLMYERFNERDIDGVVAMLSEGVLWANGMEGGYVEGHKGIREYWTRQWALANPHVEPIAFKEAEDGAIVVEVKQVIRDNDGKPVQVQGLKDKMVRHVFHFRDEKVQRFDVGED